MISDDDPPMRVVRAHLWWMASELVARHDELHVIANPPDLPFDRYTILRSWPEGLEGCIELVSNGRIHTPLVADYEPITWRQATDDPHGVLRRLEETTRLGAPRATSPTDPKLVCYRALAHVLAGAVSDARDWDTTFGVAQFFDPDSVRPELDDFPSVVEYLRHPRHGEDFERPAYRLWLLLCDRRAVAVIDVDGWLHQRDRPPVDLAGHVARSGSVEAAVTATMGHLLV